MTSLQKKYERLRVIPGEIGISPSLPALEQVPSLSSGRKRKAQELEPKVRIYGLECNRSIPEGVQFVNNQVDVDTLLSYLVMASNIDTLANQRRWRRYGHGGWLEASRVAGSGDDDVDGQRCWPGGWVEVMVCHSKQDKEKGVFMVVGGAGGVMVMEGGWRHRGWLEVVVTTWMARGVGWVGGWR
ncbi:hypothetical protein Tco_0167435 [Tanacetum coccineum]